MQARPLVGVEGGQDGVVVLAGDPPDVAQERRARLGQVHGVEARVGRVATSLDEAALLEPVDERDEPGRRRPQQLRERLLAAAGRLRDGAQQARLGRREVELADPPRERLRAVRPELGEQECRPRHRQSLRVHVENDSA